MKQGGTGLGCEEKVGARWERSRVGRMEEERGRKGYRIIIQVRAAHGTPGEVLRRK